MLLVVTDYFLSPSVIYTSYTKYQGFDFRQRQFVSRVVLGQEIELEGSCHEETKTNGPTT